MSDWQPIETAPKDKPILAWCDHEADPYFEEDSGRVRDWPQGTTADIHYKVCDAGEYELLDGSKRAVAKKRSGYVPDMLGVGEPSWGNYIIMKIGADGLIDGWEPPEIDPELWSWEPQS